MKTPAFNVPDSLDINNKDLIILFAATVYEKGKLSLGQAAGVAGLTKRTFLELPGNYNIPRLIFLHLI